MSTLEQLKKRVDEVEGYNEDLAMESHAAQSHLRALLQAWDSLPGPGRYPANRVGKWLAEDMAPAIAGARAFLRDVAP